MDLYPTLAELAGLTPPEDLDGRSFVPVLSDPASPGRDVVLSQFSRPFKPRRPDVMGYSIRTPTHRYTRWVKWPSKTVMTEELYDYTKVQPAEHGDRKSSWRSRLAELREPLQQ